MSGSSLIGKTLRGHYYITDKIGEGGIGETYLAIDKDQPEDYQCVIKRLKPQNTNQSTIMWLQRTFNREAVALQRLGSHDQIPRLLAFFREDEEFFIAQEFIHGINLRTEFINSPKWSENQVISLLDNILEVLDFVHQNQVIHRDLKPENLIQRSSDHKIVLIDFGAVKEVGTQIINTKGKKVSTSFIIGTPGYMPMEQLRQNPMLCSDIYAVGMIAIEALTGLHPTKLLDSYTGQIIWRDRLKIREDLAEILDKMIAYNPHHRYQSASECLQAIRDCSQCLNHAVQTSILLSLPPIYTIVRSGSLYWLNTNKFLVKFLAITQYKKFVKTLGTSLILTSIVAIIVGKGIWSQILMNNIEVMADNIPLPASSAKKVHNPNINIDKFLTYFINSSTNLTKKNPTDLPIIKLIAHNQTSSLVLSRLQTLRLENIQIYQVATPRTYNICNAPLQLLQPNHSDRLNLDWQLDWTTNGNAHVARLKMQGYSGKMRTISPDGKGGLRTVEQTMQLYTSAKGYVLLGFNPLDVEKQQAQRYKTNNLIIRVEIDGSTTIINCDDSGNISSAIAQEF
ncbi:serine/threonine-protein kinase [Nostoc parmelioides]|uniref:non-specific serine/threonine protein kinase n=1 Tax=Nostoc parmelioides FACHB-3921 TaxID=2692909 RepID=A0ABR8BEM8_9NOSO|nr:serine/threonine-protein kinase [Nostoc parmelioides]MBD2252336.1 serine/threonine protein kinase [Nostoc parmelioides FACHB-3921]